MMTDSNYVTLIDHMGSDLSVVNAARVSFAKAHTEFDEKQDTKLIKYLAKHNHWSPFGHASAQFHIKAPIFVARQLVKHQVGLVWNEMSRRYVDDEPEFYRPKEWRKASKNKKQGSSDEIIMGYDGTELNVDIILADTHVHDLYRASLASYNELLRIGVAPEMARMVLPQSLYTEWYWSGSLMAFARICNLRCKPDAQKETQDVAWKIDKYARKLFPASWKALRDEK